MVVKGDLDELAVYLGADYQVTDKITIHHPTVEEIAQFGEQRYYSTIFLLTCIPSDMKFQLEDLGFNYMKVENYDLFLFLTRSLDKDQTSLLFGDLDLSKMILAKDDNNGEMVLADPDTGAKIDKIVYLRLVNFLRKVHRIEPKVQNAANETTRQILIKLDREKAAKAANKPYESQLKMVLSSLMRNPSCTVSFNELKKMPIYTIMDTLMGVQVFTTTNALLIGSYSGMVDTSKINKKEFDWMRDINDKSSPITEQTNNKSPNDDKKTSLKK